MDSEDTSRRYGHPFDGAIREQLSRILAADAFRNTPQLSAFLRLIVERELAGRGAELKGYTIATEALGRPPEFDPQSDPIVRVEAGRLRRTLAQYYDTVGLNDPIRITIPVGSYVPLLEAVERGEAATGDDDPGTFGPGAPPRQSRRIKSLPVLAFAAAALLLVVGATAFYRFRSPPQPANLVLPNWEPALDDPASLGPAQTAKLVVVIGDTPGDPAATERARIFATLLIDALARFGDLLSVALLPAHAAPPADTSYLLEITSLPLDGKRGGYAQLRAFKDNRVVWATSSEGDELRNATTENVAAIARRMATRLAEPFGIIHADARRFAPATATKCLYGAIDLRRDMKPDDTGAVRNCLETIVARQPDFHPAWSFLSLLLSGEPGSGPPIDRGSMDRALLAAGMAIRLAPGNARAQQAMMDALALRGDVAGAEAAGREALKANPYDPDIAADLGALLVQNGKAEEGLPMLNQAIEQGAGEVSWYQFFAFVARYLLGTEPLAGTDLPFIAIADSFYGQFYRALIAARAADSAALAQARAGMATTAPGFASDPLRYLREHGFSEPVAKRLLADIGAGSGAN